MDGWGGAFSAGPKILADFVRPNFKRMGGGGGGFFGEFLEIKKLN